MKENKNVSLINNDFSGISDVANNLINKLSDCVGWCANRETPKKIAISTYIADIQKSNRDPLVKAALISNAKKILKEYCNQYDIINIAINSLKEDSTPESIDEDWISIFMDRARLVSSEEFKLIWGDYWLLSVKTMVVFLKVYCISCRKWIGKMHKCLLLCVQCQ